MKKLIVAAVAAAVVAPVSVMASAPVLYGKLQMSVNLLDNNASAGPDYSETSLNSNHSLMGFKGSEDLGNGMKIGYLIEWSLDMDGDNSTSGAGDLNERNRAVTLSGEWGTILVGKWDTPLKTVGRKVELFAERLGDQRNMNSGVALDARADNVIAYVTPNMNGLSATVAYVTDASDVVETGLFTSTAGTDGADNSDNSAISANVIYNNGPILVAAAYEQFSDGNFLTAANTTPEDQTTWRLAGSYSFGDFKVLGTYTDISDGAGIVDNDFDIWTIGGSYAMGNNTIKVQYGTRDRSDVYVDTGADQWAIGLDHTMSNRTTVYVEYATLDNEGLSSSRSWATMGNNALGDAGEDTDGFGVGIIHKF
ncbi:MAG: porin [Thiohalomonas sp.]|nr:porin [Thiohalomonas sp.]